jgi:hypothetical protein
MPVRRTWRHVQSGNVLFLMTGATFLAVLAVPVKPAFNILGVRVVVVALAWEVTRRMAVETTRMFEYGNCR